MSAVSGLAVGLYFELWLHWPTFLSIATGATLAVVMMLFATSLGDDPARADAAWRAAAPDLVARDRAAASDLELPPGTPGTGDRAGGEPP